MMNRILIASALLAALTAAARADDPVPLGTFDDWEAFTYNQGAAPVCFVMSSPKKADAPQRVAKRDPAYAMVSHFPGHKVRAQFSTRIGYPFKESSTATLAIDDQSFTLYTNGDTAWVADAETEARIVKLLKSGHSMSITGTSWKGTETTDSYTLAGISKALEKIDAACK